MPYGPTGRPEPRGTYKAFWLLVSTIELPQRYGRLLLERQNAEQEQRDGSEH